MYIALSDDGNLLDSKTVETTKEHYHSAFLISTIKNILKDNGLTPHKIDAIATNIGPGSFTGIRACTTVARVFAQAVGAKTVGVSSLEILSRANDTKKQTLVALDARKEMAYVAVFDCAKQVLAPQSMLIDELKELIAQNDYFIVSDDKLAPILGGISYQQQDCDLGKYLIQIASEKIKTDFDTNWKKLLPLYIQPAAVHVKKPK